VGGWVCGWVCGWVGDSGTEHGCGKEAIVRERSETSAKCTLQHMCMPCTFRAVAGAACDGRSGVRSCVCVRETHTRVECVDTCGYFSMRVFVHVFVTLK
jgi:hypothetical protein